MLASTNVMVIPLPGVPITPAAIVISSPTAYPVPDPDIVNAVVSTAKSAAANVITGSVPAPAEAPNDAEGIVIVSPSTYPEPVVVTVTELIEVAPPTTIVATAPVPAVPPVKGISV